CRRRGVSSSEASTSTPSTYSAYGLSAMGKTARAALRETDDPAVLGPDDDPAAGDGRRRGDGAARLEVPELFALAQVEHIEAPVARADVHTIPDDDRRRVDACARREGPAGFSGRGVEPVHHLVAAAEHDGPVRDRCRRVERELAIGRRIAPHLFARLQID